MTEKTNQLELPPGLDRLVAHATGQAVFGLGVLSTLVAGLEEELAAPPGFRSLEKAVLGCAMWTKRAQLCVSRPVPMERVDQLPRPLLNTAPDLDRPDACRHREAG